MTLSPEVLSGLRERLAVATEGDGELDRDIALALGWSPPAMGLPFWYDDESNHWSALPDWSTSIDASVQLSESIAHKHGRKLICFFCAGGQLTSRTDGLQVPLPVFDFGRLPQLSTETLKAIGCQKWDEPDADGNVLWLYPSEWYDHIPDGTIVTDINGKTEAFVKGQTDDDMRFGALAYGFIRHEVSP